MIVGSTGPKVIGQQYWGITDERNHYYPDHPFIVVREATFEEWLAGHLERGGAPLTPQQLAKAKSPTSFFYEIATD